MTRIDDPRPPARPRETWRPRAKIRPCLICNKPRISSSASDRMHAGCRPTGENEGERAALVRLPR
jgi:hypothetical protein